MLALAERCDCADLWEMFDRVPVRAFSSSGVAYIRWVPSGMPKLGKYTRLLKSVFFLYPNRTSAEAGVGSGATGFIALIPIPSLPGYFHSVGITNWHAVVRDGLSVVRLNKKDGGFDIFDHGPDEWLFLPGLDDVAVIPLGADRRVHDFIGFAASMFMSDADQKASEIDVGDDVFMAGRFIDYDGIEVNQPSVRFGHISIIDARVKQPTGYMGRSIVLDMHSRTGFSGSPVFVYRTSGSFFGEIPNDDIAHADQFFGHTMLCLGMLWGQFPEAWELSEKTKLKANSNLPLVTEGKYVAGMSGMSCVIPSQRILETLEMPALKKKLAAMEAAIPEAVKTAVRNAPVAQSAVPPSTAENPTHREDFTRLLGAAVKRPEPKD